MAWPFDARTRGSSGPADPDISVPVALSSSIVACLRLCVPLAVNDDRRERTAGLQGVWMNVRRKWRYLVLAAAGSLVWALSAGLSAAHAAGPADPATGTGATVSV